MFIEIFYEMTVFFLQKNCLAFLKSPSDLSKTLGQITLLINTNDLEDICPKNDNI